MDILVDVFVLFINCVVTGVNVVTDSVVFVSNVEEVEVEMVVTVTLVDRFNIWVVVANVEGTILVAIVAFVDVDIVVLFNNWVNGAANVEEFELETVVAVTLNETVVVFNNWIGGANVEEFELEAVVAVKLVDTVVIFTNWVNGANVEEFKLEMVVAVALIDTVVVFNDWIVVDVVVIGELLLDTYSLYLTFAITLFLLNVTIALVGKLPFFMINPLL